jgi:hypothetical protein
MDDCVYDIFVDISGNVYVTGYVWSAFSASDFATVKYNSAGVQQWAQIYYRPVPNPEFPFGEQGYSVKTDFSGNVYVSGYSFDQEYITVGYTTIKYNSNGIQQWVQFKDSVSQLFADLTSSIAVDSAGNSYVTGNGPTVKYNSAGVEIWERNTAGNKIIMDNSGFIYAAGTTGTDYGITKYNTSGVLLWAQTYNGPGNGNDIITSIFIDRNNCVYVTGNSMGSGTNTDYATLKYIQLPIAPNLISPPNGSLGQPLTPLLDWDSLAAASTYKVQVSRNLAFSSIVIDSAGNVNSNMRIPSGRLSFDSTYYWRVCALNIVGQGQWSEIWSFRTASFPSAPVLITPPNGSQGQSLTPLLDWSAVSGAASYRVQVTTDSAFTVINTLDSSSVTGDSLRIPSGRLSNNVRYFWRVCAVNITGSGPWSVIWNFRVGYIGLLQTSNGIPFKYKLYFNYPNPFNPVTKIKFDVPKRDFVIVKIYDVLGREVATLVNEQLQPGTYEAEFDGTNYPSGIYYYTIKTTAFSQTKKMVLIK